MVKLIIIFFTFSKLLRAQVQINYSREDFSRYSYILVCRLSLIFLKVRFALFANATKPFCICLYSTLRLHLSLLTFKRSSFSYSLAFKKQVVKLSNFDKKYEYYGNS
jgi:hypothetical protein